VNLKPPRRSLKQYQHPLTPPFTPGISQNGLTPFFSFRVDWRPFAVLKKKKPRMDAKEREVFYPQISQMGAGGFFFICENLCLLRIFP